MGRAVIVLYRPKKGKDEQVLELVRNHLPVLRSQKLVTDRDAMFMRAADGTIIEIFEWASSDAIGDAHQNPVVQELWKKFGEVCDYEVPANLKEFQNLFSEFEMIR